ncbi:hypothetical protein JQ614_32265 [Bradyrhizobium diazoefficiens]|uniref:hypothetical protein n=1 Tax=Bradyrhizobium diazoefficiens TaxID=1355477 RepID=UPI001B8C109A|nr:hypothetical protein [Bradyrhizobium diazoefficiens]MBR0866304.1 hypothetical protein [Bradyrhizobium diazoefficiens]MBR0890765.1 hypothetical protein [Bradyrhizobium diazoefficiens]MBR0922598.1 hypothetical protein [Bradyrhizobium diazoefficiens]
MIVGHNHHRLESRISAALLSGIPYSREAEFLQKMSRRIHHKGSNASLSNKQAEWLLAILTRCEAKSSPTTKEHRPTLRPRTAEPTVERHDVINITDCLIEPKVLPQHLPTQPDRIVPPTSARPAEAPDPMGTPEPDIGSIFRRILARNENIRKHRERIERQRLKS